MLDYFTDTLANIWLPEVWLEYKSNFVTWIGDKCVKRESNCIGGELSQIQKNLESNQVWNNESNQVVNYESNQIRNGESNQVRHGE